MKVLILGGDGYLGWPTAMHLSGEGHDVTVVDNYLRRNLQQREDMEALFAVPNLHDRANLWRARSGHNVAVRIGDLRDWAFTSTLFESIQPDAVVHYAEQPSAPFSMASTDAARLTLMNNLEVTANTIFAVREFCPSAHIVKLGTMGEYGTPNIDIEEGFIDIEHKGRSGRFLFPRQAGSLYHTTKIMDTDLLWFYVRTWGLRVTDLMQGPVYGLVTEENEGDERLFPFFCYDEMFGTVINRFAVQAVAGHPLTVYGKGGQTRGYLNIRDTLQCIRLSLEQPADSGELRVFNQFTETFSVNEIAQRIKHVGDSMGLGVQIESLENPRKEMEEHYYNPAHTGLTELGLKPTLMSDDILAELLQTVRGFADQIVEERIFRGVKWV